MKKILIVLMLVLVSCSLIFAETPKEPIVAYDSINMSFVPTFARFDAMGASGIADPSRLDSYFLNPAALSNGGFALSVPSFSFTFYNLQKLISDEATMEKVNKIFDGSADDGDKTAVATKLIENLGKGYNMLFKTDASLALKLGIFGFGSNLQLKVHALNEGNSIVSQYLIPELNIAQTIAIGLRLVDTDVISVSAGASAHFVYKAYFKAIGANEIISIINDSNQMEEKLMWNTPLMAGYAMPIDLGVTVGFLQDQLTVSATANNINGTYNMKSYTGTGVLLNELSEGSVKQPAAYTANESQEFKVKTPMTLNLGAAFAPKSQILQPVITADLVDMLDMIQNFDASKFRASDLLLHLNVGAEVGLLNILKVRAGVNRGFMSLGAGVWLPGVQVDAAYGWQEFGQELGDKPVDSFTIKFNLGWDR